MSPTTVVPLPRPEDFAAYWASVKEQARAYRLEATVEPEWLGLLAERPDLEGAVRETMAYFDALSFAPEVHCPALVSLGQADTVCPPEGIRELFRRLPAEKSLLEIPGLDHRRSALWRQQAANWMRCWV
jgi:cephalosporin-C deacetylase-like acetyl esterase